MVCHAGALRLTCTSAEYERLDRALARSIKLIYCLIRSTTYAGALAICSVLDTRSDLGRLMARWKHTNSEYEQIFQQFDTLESSNLNLSVVKLETFRIIFSWQNKFNKNGSNTILEISQEDRLKVNKENNFIYLGFQRIAVKDIFCTQKCFN